MYEWELEEFLLRLFDEGEVVRFEWDPDIIDVVPVEESRKGDGNGLERDILDGEEDAV